MTRLTAAQIEEIRERHSEACLDNIYGGGADDIDRLLGHIAALDAVYDNDTGVLEGRLADRDWMLDQRDDEIARLRKRLEGAAYFDCTPPYIIPRRTISLDELKKQSGYKPPNVAGMFAPNEDPRGGSDGWPQHIIDGAKKHRVSPEVYDKKMEDARQLMRDFRRPGRD